MKATGDDVPGDILRLKVEDGLKIMTQLMHNTYKTGEWPWGFIQVIRVEIKQLFRQHTPIVFIFIQDILFYNMFRSFTGPSSVKTQLDAKLHRTTNLHLYG